MSNIEAESSMDKSVPVDAVYVHTVEARQQTSDLGHTPTARFSPRKFIKSLGSKDAWFGDYVSSF